ncbi:MAG: PLP-dependent aspartate aminotransferase family protein [Bacteroidota bacterium]|nr:PLP-dependent aspartate aminotransferase family protein [Bacteroidota bacterium]
MSKNNNNKKSTKCVHSGNLIDEKYHGNISPIYPSITYDFIESDVYPRYFNTPNQIGVCEKISDLENAELSLLFGSGLGAISTTMLSLLKKGDHIILQDSLYGGTINLVNTEFKKFGIEHSYVDVNEKDKLYASLRKNSKVIYIESPSNPLLKIIDLLSISDFAKNNNLVSIIDNTFASPINQNPIDLGIDLVIHSATKYLSGHSDILAGSVSGTKKKIEIIKSSGLNFGSNISEYTAWMLERSIKTLKIRVSTQNDNALNLSKFLLDNNFISKVFYPGLENHKNHAIAKAQMHGFGGMLSFELNSNIDPIKFVKDLKIIKPTMSLAGVESTITSPVLSSHKKMDPEVRRGLGISDNLLRFSVGIEDFEDLMLDLDKALIKNGK